MNLSPPLPDWMPWWAQLAILMVAILFGLALLMMPFAVFGVKGRIDFLQNRLDDVHAELRMLATRIPEPERRAASREAVAEELVPRSATPPAQPSPTRTRTAPGPAPAATSAPVREPAPVLSRRPPGVDWPPAVSIEPEDERPLRPSRAGTLRGFDREDRARAEPTLRWPPPPSSPLR